MNSSLTSQPNDHPPQTPTAAGKQIFPGEVFGNTADFDAGIRQLLPRYDEMLDTIVRCIPSNSLRILELGCGTGELSLKILNRYPTAQLVAVDYSPRMLEFAQEKIHAAGYAGRVTWVEADFGELANNQKSMGEGFDCAVSSLAIHHLRDEMKLKLLDWINQNLNTGGCFWNADPILPELPAMAEVYKAVREEWASTQGKSLAEVRAKIGNSTPQGHSNPDQLATLMAHLEMLKTAGFEPVAVPWKYYGLAVFGGFKP
ncbi:methyltransferase domain-containing protein [Microcoleus sp. FACHB-68]|uniref:class I SAM-dependent methyltransferase n=1 Tax=Microcoleus sp. FACHB-68 TaxID=2692826 RepID=UPI00321F757A